MGDQLTASPQAARRAWVVATRGTASGCKVVFPPGRDPATFKVDRLPGGPDADPAGAATMTGPHLCEYEKWPSSRRRPSVYVLSMLAAIYQASVASLLDLADHEALPQPDRFVLVRQAPASDRLAGGLRLPSASTGVQPVLASDQAGQGVSVTLPYVPGRLVIEVCGPPGAAGQSTGGSDTPRAAGLLTLVCGPQPARDRYR